MHRGIDAKSVTEINFVNSGDEYESIVGWGCYPNNEKSIQSHRSPEFLNSLSFIKKFYPTPRWGEGKFTKVTPENSSNLRHSERLAKESSNTNLIQLQGEKNSLTETVFSRFTSHFSLPKAAFTLAEVLITLGIIGVVAALTIPNLIAKYQLMEGITAYKKTVSILNQAAAKVVSDLGYVPDCYSWLPGERPYPDMWNCIKTNEMGACIQYGDDKGNPRPSDYNERTSECSIYKAELLKNLKIIKTCERAYYDNCTVEYKGSDTLLKEQNNSLTDNDLIVATAAWTSLRAESIKNAPSIVLEDGTVLLYYNYSTDFLVDVNGRRGPNKWGYDLIWLSLFGAPKKGLFYQPLNALVEKGGISASELMLK